MFIKPKEVIEFLSSHLFLLSGWSIADFGCGGGYFTTLLAEKTGPDGKVFAIDSQEDAIKETKELAELLGFQNIEFHKANLKKTAFENNFFDLIFISQVLFQNNKVKNKFSNVSFSAVEEIISEAKRVLRDGGYMVLLEPKNQLNFLYGDIVEKDKILSIIKNQGLNLVIDKEFHENYYIIVVEK
ncbi:MAG: class I SAM-dependent methyltransferase [Patescibacteria group bacterium]